MGLDGKPLKGVSVQIMGETGEWKDVGHVDSLAITAEAMKMPPQKWVTGVEDPTASFANFQELVKAHVLDAQETALKAALGINDVSEWPNKPPHKGAKWTIPESALNGLDAQNARALVRLLEQAGWTVHVLVPETEQPFTYGSPKLIKGIDLGHELRQFRLHCKSKRVTSLDWDAEFEKWLGNARTPSSGGTKPTTSNKVRDGIALAERLATEEANVVPIRPQIEGA